MPWTPSSCQGSKRGRGCVTDVIMVCAANTVAEEQRHQNDNDEKLNDFGEI